ncbi:copper amine oxidase N-terminal domain-containing protein [Desulfoscipio sp. XC116]|uniref:copper amine oxidase N-terminal domain-containing protein n=1 Tax=Desulfoscipio sp. XC116 TaxID=3144975 RepID=UPI00325BB4BA
MKKKGIILILALVLGMQNFAAPAFAAVNTLSRPAEINVNGEFVQTDTHPVLSSGRLLVPIRALSSLGLTYTWDSKTNTATISDQSSNFVKVTINSKTAYKNSTAIQLDVSAQIQNNRVFVPVRFVAEALGYNVQYEALRDIVFVKSADYTMNSDVLTQTDDLQAARKAAISLPLTANFEILSFKDPKTYDSEDYVFPEGKADNYIFSDSRVQSFVEIKNGKAEVVGQILDGALGEPYVKTAGDITITRIPASRGSVCFGRIGDKTIANYGELGRVTGSMKIYSDLILKLPANM